MAHARPYHSHTWSVRYLNCFRQHPISELHALQGTGYLAALWSSYRCINLDDRACSSHHDHTLQLVALHDGMLRHLRHLLGWLFPLEVHLIGPRYKMEHLSISYWLL